MNENVAYIFIDKMQVAERSNSCIFELIIECICYFFIFNLIYPKELSQTLEFYVRYFLNYRPSNVRGCKKNINNISKIHNLLKKINEN